MSAKIKTQIKSYQDASEFLGNKNERPIAHNTRVQRLNLDRIGILYHGNCIVTFTPKETIFSSCGWFTSTTKERLNWFLPDGYSIYQEKYQWYFVKRHWNDEQGWILDDKCKFYNGLTILA